VALRRVRTTLPRYVWCDPFVAFAVFGRHVPSRASGEPRGNVVRAGEVRHGDSGCYGARDGVARSGCVPHVGIPRCLER
jgi:hypothetical protein